MKKLNGFLDYIATESNANADNKASESRKNHETTLSVLGRAKRFLVSLTNDDSDGRIFSERGIREDGQCACLLKFVMLNPAANFHPLVEGARCVILLGGTMQPFEHFTRQLFPKLESSKVRFFECDHVVPPQNVRTLSLSKGPAGQSLYLNFKSRVDPIKIDELARVLLNFAKIVPEGFVVFLPSFGYKKTVQKRWSEQGFAAKICKHKLLLWESKNLAPSETLKKYSDILQEKKGGAILMCVVGGKLSEGINFSDGLARCVAVIGMPYPNSEDAYIKEKIKWINKTFEKQSEEKAAETYCRKSTGRSPGMQYYENLCMRMVNQSIGRSIRHKRDFSCILLIDQRYSTSRISNQLPGWIQRSLVSTKSFGDAYRNLREFFSIKREKV